MIFGNFITKKTYLFLGKFKAIEELVKESFETYKKEDMPTLDSFYFVENDDYFGWISGDDKDIKKYMAEKGLSLCDI